MLGMIVDWFMLPFGYGFMRRALMVEALDPGFLRVQGARPAWIQGAFMTLVVLSLVTGFQALGTLMAVGLMILPATLARFWSRRLEGMAAVAAGSAMVGTLTFVLTRTLPGDMAYRIAAGRYGHDMVDTAAAEAVRAELALDQPALTAYFGWLWDLLQLDLGRSLVSGEPMIQGTALVMGLMFVALNTAVDLICHWLDPRRRET